MPRGEKSKYTDKQEHKADHIAEGYEKRGVGKKEAERRAWATVNKDDGGGKRPGGSVAAPIPAIRRRKRRTHRRQGRCFETSRRPLGLGQEGGGNAQA
jgi:plasmid stabilization system protein ParE